MPGQAIVTIKDRQWGCSVASTPAELVTGLSGVPSMPVGTGMLFVLPQEQIVTVTAEGMLFPLDVIFVGDNLLVTEVAFNLIPGDWGTTSLPCRYFLEVNAGEADAIEAGNPVSIEFSAAPATDWMAPVVMIAGVMMVGALMAQVGKTMLEKPREKPEIYGPRGERLSPATKKGGSFVIGHDYMGNLIITHTERTGEIFLQFESDRQTVYDILKKWELKEVEKGWSVQVKDTEPRASILDELWESSAQPQGLPQTTPRSSRLEELEAEARELRRKIRAKYPARVPEPWPEELKMWQGRLWQLGGEIDRERERLRKGGEPQTKKLRQQIPLNWYEIIRQEPGDGQPGYLVWNYYPGGWPHRPAIEKVQSWIARDVYEDWQKRATPWTFETWKVAIWKEAGKPITEMGKPTRHEVEIGTWAERDRIGIWITDKRTDKTIAEWWDEDAQEMFEQGWFKPGDVRHQKITGRAFEESVLDYAESVGLLAGSGKYLPQTVQSGYYWTAFNKDTGEIAESSTPYASSGRALRGGKAFASRHWKGTALVEVWSQPHGYSEKPKTKPVASEMVTLAKSSAVIPTEPRRPRRKDELEFLPDSPEFLAYTIDDIGYRDKIDNAFLGAIARAKGR